MENKDLWDMDSAMQVLGHKTVDSKLWAEAVEWLLHNGPPEIRKILLDASEIAANSTFPDLKPNHYTTDGQAYYDVSDLAKSLGIKAAEAQEILRKKEEDQNGKNSSENDTKAVTH